MNLLKAGEATRASLVQWAIVGEHPVPGLVSVPAGSLVGYAEVVGKLLTYLRASEALFRALGRCPGPGVLALDGGQVNAAYQQLSIVRRVAGLPEVGR